MPEARERPRLAVPGTDQSRLRMIRNVNSLAEFSVSRSSQAMSFGPPNRPRQPAALGLGGGRDASGAAKFGQPLLVLDDVVAADAG